MEPTVKHREEFDKMVVWIVRGFLGNLSDLHFTFDSSTGEYVLTFGDTTLVRLANLHPCQFDELYRAFLDNEEREERVKIHDAAKSALLSRQNTTTADEFGVMMNKIVHEFDGDVATKLRLVDCSSTGKHVLTFGDKTLCSKLHPCQIDELCRALTNNVERIPAQGVELDPSLLDTEYQIFHFINFIWFCFTLKRVAFIGNDESHRMRKRLLLAIYDNIYFCGDIKTRIELLSEADLTYLANLLLEEEQDEMRQDLFCAGESWAPEKLAIKVLEVMTNGAAIQNPIPLIKEGRSYPLIDFGVIKDNFGRDIMSNDFSESFLYALAVYVASPSFAASSYVLQVDVYLKGRNEHLMLYYRGNGATVSGHHWEQKLKIVMAERFLPLLLGYYGPVSDSTQDNDWFLYFLKKALPPLSATFCLCGIANVDETKLAINEAGWIALCDCIGNNRTNCRLERICKLPYFCYPCEEEADEVDRVPFVKAQDDESQGAEHVLATKLFEAMEKNVTLTALECGFSYLEDELYAHTSGFRQMVAFYTERNQAFGEERIWTGDVGDNEGWELDLLTTREKEMDLKFVFHLARSNPVALVRAKGKWPEQDGLFSAAVTRA